MELDDAVHTAILTLKEGYIYLELFVENISAVECLKSIERLNMVSLDLPVVYSAWMIPSRNLVKLFSTM